MPLSKVLDCRYSAKHQGHRPQGYIWWSDSTVPSVYMGDSPVEIEPDELESHFIIEAFLYDKEECKSYSVKYIDGKYHFYVYDGITEEEIRKQSVSFVPNRMKETGVSAVKFVRRWRPVADPYCEGMQVMQPMEFMFVGFEIK